MHTPPGAMPAGPTPGMPVGMGMGMEGMMAGGTARGVRYVAVRGVVPYRTQLEKLARALNLETTAEALNYLQYQDFEIERQKAVAGGAPWSGEWEKLDVQVAVDLVNQAASWDADVVATEVTDSIFTMPLPARLNGFWTDDVSHPRLEQWRLNEEQRQTELEKNEALLEQAGDGVGGKKGGFGKVQRDLGGMSRGGMMPGMPGMSPAMPGMPAMPGNPAMPGPGMRPGSAMHAGPGMRPGSMPSAMPSAMPPGMMPGGHRPGPGGMPASRMPGNPAMPGMGPAMPGMGNMGMAGTAQTRIVPMLLFRFLDTVVEPGAAYRYRVRLIAANPNVGLPPEQVENPAVAEGETRNTEWSVPTPPVVIPFDTQYFVAKVPRSAGKPQAGAEMVVFQWNSDTGTLVSHTFKDVVGKPIGGKTKSSLLDLTKGFIEKDAEVTIRTPDVLLDSVGLGGVTAVALPGAPSSTLKRTMDDLAIDKATWTRMIDSGALDLAVTVNPAGEILVNDGISTASAKVAAEKKVEAEREPYKDIEPAGEGPSGLDAIMMQQMMMNGGPAGGHGTDKKAAKGKKGNPLRIGGPSAMMMGPGMMPPGMGPAGMSPMPGSMSPAMMDAMKKSKKK